MVELRQQLVVARVGDGEVKLEVGPDEGRQVGRVLPHRGHGGADAGEVGRQSPGWPRAR